MPRATVGLRLGLVVGTFGCIGSIVGGMHADYLHKRGDRGGTVRSAILATIVLVPTAAITTLIPDPNYSLLLYAPLLFFGSWVFPLAVMTLQLFTPPSMRAQTSAIYLFVVALFSMGFGSTSVALITDFVFANDLKLHYSMAIVGRDQRRFRIVLPVAAASDLPPGHGRQKSALALRREGVSPGKRASPPCTGAGCTRSQGLGYSLMQTNLTVSQAERLILQTVPEWPAERIPLLSASGRILRQNVCAERDLPPYDRATMDGIAMNWRARPSGQREFPLEGMQSASQPPATLSSSSSVWRIATGAPLPAGADTVVPVERITETDGTVRIANDYRPKLGQFVHKRGSDRRAGALLLKAGQRIGGVEMALLSANGIAEPLVAPDPRITLISTGDELVGLDARPKAWQIRSSNGPAMQALLDRHGYGKVRAMHAPDEPEVLADRISEALSQSDALILSGGVSKGAKDYVPGVLAKLRTKPVFHRVRQRPGFPLWFGMHGEKPVFGLPGNPVSSLVCLRRYVVAALGKAQGAQTTTPEYATLTEAVTFRPALTWFLPVRLATSRDGQLLAHPRQTNTSGDFASLAQTDGFAQLSANHIDFPAGIPARIFRWNTT